MTKCKRAIIKITLVFFILFPIAALAHFLVFPQQTRSMLIDCSDFKKDGRIYFSSSTEKAKIDTLKLLIARASNRIDEFWGQKTCNPRFIYCDNKADFKKFCSSPAAPAVTHLKFGSVIILSGNAADIDIIAHEISHAELYQRAGFYTFTFVIPSWFKHGMAMQNDYRPYYSEDTLKARSGNFRHMPDIRNFTSDVQFYTGSLEQVMLNYMAASHEIKKWYSKSKLDKLLNDLHAGKSFDNAYGK